MGAQYLVRFDDVAPTMRWSVWERVERLLDAWQIKPIVAVVPNNRDPRLHAEPARPDFWDRVRGWQAKHWAIGWHGYEHVYSSPSAGLVGVHRGSEFAGVAESEQRARLDRAARVFRGQNVVPDVWVAPGHAFDWTTVRLLPEYGIRVISDGLFARPVRWGACTWVPQQLWRFRDLPFGVWTVCHHINAWTQADLDRFERDVASYRERIVALGDVLAGPLPARNWLDWTFAHAYRGAIRLRASAGRGRDS